MPDENELYKQWRSATDRRHVEEKLYRAVSRHAAAVVLSKFPEGCRDLVPDIAAAVMSRIESFRGESKFSTWVHAIAKLKTAEALRTKKIEERVFDATKVVVSGPDENIGEYLENGAGESLRTTNLVYAETHSDFDGPIAFEELCDRLSDEEEALLNYKCEGLSSYEIASKFGINAEALDSRWARLKKKLPRSDG